MKALYEILEEIKKYKELLADIRELDFKIEEYEENFIRDSEDISDIKLSKTNNAKSMVEKVFENKENLLMQKFKKKMRLKRIDNALSILSDEERDIIQIVYIDSKRYCMVQDKLNLSYQRIKQLEKQGAEKMEKYIFVNE
ncbi:sigma factor-like helix-turn-helix DNA-binding protein [Clostridium diolis]|uniref:sigma factor-like helix-turn-helix DNA-binding protein n=1 Tax=Clostridium diolis TaxID=223919 RepID=UPI003AF82A42